MKIFIGILGYIVLIVLGLMFFYGTKPRDKNGKIKDDFDEEK